jgi:hypothetical protein
MANATVAKIAAAQRDRLDLSRANPAKLFMVVSGGVGGPPPAAGAAQEKATTIS